MPLIDEDYKIDEFIIKTINKSAYSFVGKKYENPSK